VPIGSESIGKHPECKARLKRKWFFRGCAFLLNHGIDRIFQNEIFRDIINMVFIMDNNMIPIPDLKKTLSRRAEKSRRIYRKPYLENLGDLRTLTLGPTGNPPGIIILGGRIFLPSTYTRSGKDIHPDSTPPSLP